MTKKLNTTQLIALHRVAAGRAHRMPRAILDELLRLGVVAYSGKGLSRQNEGAYSKQWTLTEPGLALVEWLRT